MAAEGICRVLIIDDDVRLCSLLTERLAQEGYGIECAHDGVHGLERACSQEHSLIILDLMLPGLAGLDVLRRLRPLSAIPVIILTARGEEVERILGLELGADDYLAKPFSPRELIARIRAILRRTSAMTCRTRVVELGGIKLDSTAREAFLDGALLNLTSVEFTLLETFLSRAGSVMTREYLTRMVLGRERGPFDRVIDVHVSNLRKKLSSPEEGERIKSVRGSGYLFAARSLAS